MSVAERPTVPINDLVLIPELSPRARLCEETVIRYMESFSALPPVRVQAKTNVVVDGYHRVEAAIRLGLEEIEVKVENIDDEELKMVAGLANVEHGQPLTRAERNKLAVALVRTYGKLREEAAELLGMSPNAVTLALREHQFNEQLSEKLGSAVQVINSAHVRALYRVGPDQRERLLEAVVSKVDENGDPYPLTGAELKLLVDRMLDPATPTSEINRLLIDPKARPKAPTNSTASEPLRAEALDANPFVEEGGGTRPWEREWESPLKGGDGENFDRVRSVDEQMTRNHGGVEAEERQIAELLRRAEDNAGQRGQEGYNPFWGSADAPNEPQDEPKKNAVEPERLRQGLEAATRALEELIPHVEPDDIQDQVKTVLAVLKSLV